MNRTLATIMGSLMLLGLLGCTGYPDGPAISFSAAEEKLVNHWKISEATLNGQDITAEYEGEFYHFRSGGDLERLETQLRTNVPPGGDQVISELGAGQWFLRNDASQIEMLYQFQFEDPVNPSIEYTRTVNELWTIARLSQDQLWLRDDSTSLKMVLR